MIYCCRNLRRWKTRLRFTHSTHTVTSFTISNGAFVACETNYAFDAICTSTGRNGKKRKSHSIRCRGRKQLNIVAYLNRIRASNKTVHFISMHVNRDNPQSATSSQRTSIRLKYICFPFFLFWIAVDLNATRRYFNIAD